MVLVRTLWLHSRADLAYGARLHRRYTIFHCFGFVDSAEPSAEENLVIGEKVRHYEGKNTDLDVLKGKIEQYLQGEGFKVQSSAPSPHGTLIQARKGGFLRWPHRRRPSVQHPHRRRARQRHWQVA